MQAFLRLILGQMMTCCTGNFLKKNQKDDVKFSMNDAEQSSFDKTAKHLGGKKAYL